MSKFAPHVPESLINAVSLILGEAKVEPDAPDAAAVARRKALQAIKDRQEDEKAEKGEDKPKNASTKVAGHQYGGAKQKHEPEIEEELKGNQHKIDANKNGKIDADDFKKLRGEELKGNQHKIDANKNGKIDSHDFKLLRGKKKANEDIELDERELSPAEADKKEKYVKSMKKGLPGFEKRYGDKAKNVMYATATKLAKNEGYYKNIDIENQEKAEKAKKDSPFTPDKPHAPIATAGKRGYGPSAAKHLAKLGMKGLNKEETVTEGTGGPIYTKPLVKLGDLLARAKDMRNIKQATIVTPKSENEVVLKKEETEQIDEYSNTRRADMPIKFPGADPKRKPLGGGGLPDHNGRPIKDVKEEVEQIHEEMSPRDASNKATIKSMLAKKEDDNQDSDNQYDAHKNAALAHKIARDKYEKGSKEYNDHDKQHKHHLEVIGEESIKETMMGKAGCTSEDDKKKAEKPVDYDKPTIFRKVNDWRKSNPAHLPKPTKEEFVSEAHFMEIPSDVKKEIKKHIDNDDHDAARSAAVKAGYWSHFNHLVSAAAHSSHMDHDTHHTDIKQLHPYMSDYLSDKKTNESVEQLDEVGDTKAGREKLAKVANRAVGDTTKDKSRLIKKIDKKLYGNPDLRYKSEGFNTFKGVAAEIKAGTFNRSKPDPELAKQKKKDLESSFENKTKKRTEEVSIDETAVLDKYIRSMGYDPQHLDKNKKVMFAKTNAFKTYATSQRTEGLYDGGQKGTQDIDTHMSPGATARG